MSNEEATAAVAKAICIAFGEEPDMLVFPGPPYIVKGGFLTPGYAMPREPPRPLWQSYYRAAAAAISEIEMMPPEVQEMLLA